MRASSSNRPTRLFLICVACLLLLGLGNTVTGADDRADDPVLARYGTKLRSSLIKFEASMTFSVRKRPATVADVKAGRAVFTLEGLGRARIWKLPEYPCGANWTTLKQFPLEFDDGTTRYATYGDVVQAEELLHNGVWRRYFGFVHECGVAVVPADQIQLWLPQTDGPYTSWESHGGAFDFGFRFPKPREAARNSGDDDATDKPSIIEVHLRNRLGVAQRRPTDLYRDKDAGGPSLREGLKLSLEWAPFAPEDTDIYYPTFRDEVFSVVESTRRAHASTAEPGESLEPGESRPAFTVNLKDMFDFPGPGHYRFRLEVDAEKLGLPPIPILIGGRHIHSFHAGKAPRKLTLDELNAKRQALGGREKQIKAAIRKHFENLPADDLTKPPVPAGFPQFSREVRYEVYGNEHGFPRPYATWLARTNGQLLFELSEYRDADVCRLLESRMLAENQSPALKLLLAGEAAVVGSRRGAEHLLEAMKKTDYRTVENVHAVLKRSIDHYYYPRQDPPDWIVAMLFAALADDRYITDMRAEAPFATKAYTIEGMADWHADLTEALADFKFPQAVPFLIDLVRKTGRSRLITALGELGDKRAVPVLLAVIDALDDEARMSMGSLAPRSLSSAIWSLGTLRAAEAVPVLRKHLYDAGIVRALERIGDPAVIPDLERIVAAGRPKQIAGSDAESDRACVMAARIALAGLKPGDPLPRYLALLDDKTLREFDRRTVVWRLRSKPDPRAIPRLIEAVKHDPSGTVVNSAIGALGDHKYKAAVTGLIDCFDADFNRKTDWKRAYTPDMFRQNIAEALQEATGQTFGPDKDRWRQWWEDTGQAAFKAP